MEAFKMLSMSYLFLIALFVHFTVSRSIRMYRRKQRAIKYQHVYAVNDCGDTTALPKTFIGGIRHKLSMLTFAGTDIFDELFAEKYRKYGETHALHDDFEVPRVIHTCDPENVHAILSSQFNDFRMSRRRADVLHPLAQDGLGNTEGAVWRGHRKLIARHMNQKRIRDVQQNAGDIEALFAAIGEVDIAGWSAEVDLTVLFDRMALDMATAFLLGKGAGVQVAALNIGKNSTSHSESRDMTWSEAFETVRNHFSWRAKLGGLYWLADGPKYRHACRSLNRFADGLIAGAINHAEKCPTDDSRFGLTGALIREMGDVIAIRELIIDIFVAGKDMTANSLSWLFARLEHHPDIYRKVREEVLDIFGTEQSPKTEMTWDSLQKCRNLQNLILEVVRFYPLLPILGRTAATDTILPRGGGPNGKQPIAVPKGTSISCNVYMMHRLERKWGPDASEFNPDRWNKRKVGPEFAAFGAGPRICLGMNLSLGEMAYVTARLLQRFKAVKAPVGQDNLRKGFKVIVTPAAGVKMKFQQT